MEQINSLPGETIPPLKPCTPRNLWGTGFQLNIVLYFYKKNKTQIKNKDISLRGFVSMKISTVETLTPETPHGDLTQKPYKTKGLRNAQHNLS